jgi:hypothetical protein
VKWVTQIKYQVTKEKKDPWADELYGSNSVRKITKWACCTIKKIVDMFTSLEILLFALWFSNTFPEDTNLLVQTHKYNSKIWLKSQWKDILLQAKSESSKIKENSLNYEPSWDCTIYSHIEGHINLTLDGV